METVKQIAEIMTIEIAIAVFIIVGAIIIYSNNSDHKNLTS